MLELRRSERRRQPELFTQPVVALAGFAVGVAAGLGGDPPGAFDLHQLVPAAQDRRRLLVQGRDLKPLLDERHRAASAALDDIDLPVVLGSVTHASTSAGDALRGRVPAHVVVALEAVPGVFEFEFGGNGLIAADNDLDGVPNGVDNCRDNYNPRQGNLDQVLAEKYVGVVADGRGDACDSDEDGDDVLNLDDNCPRRFSRDQSDLDEDGLGDVSACPSRPSPQQRAPTWREQSEVFSTRPMIFE